MPWGGGGAWSQVNQFVMSRCDVIGASVAGHAQDDSRSETLRKVRKITYISADILLVFIQ